MRGKARCIWGMVGCLAVTVGCQPQSGGGGSDTPPGTSRLRFAAAAEVLPAFDVCVDNTVAVENVRFGRITEYGEAESGSSEITAIDAGGDCDDQISVSGRFPLASTRDYTFVILPLIDEPLQLEDDNSRTPSGQARIRLINASRDSAALDVEDEGGATLFDEVRYNRPEDFGYITVNSGTFNLVITPLGDETPFEMAETVLDAGRVYTLFAFGNVDPGADDEAFDVILVDDANPGT